MAINKVTGADKYSDFVDKYNATSDEIPVNGATTSNGVITFTKKGGGTFNVNVPASPDSVLTGCSFTVNNSGQVQVLAGTYIIDGTTYTIASTINFNLDGADADPRIDVIVVNTSSSATFVKGTAGTNPSEPTISATQLKLGVVLVSESGYGDEPYIPIGLAKDVVAASTTNLVATRVVNTLTKDTNGSLLIDAVLPNVGDRILIKDQTNKVDNGIYTLTQLGDGSSPFILERAIDFAGTANLRSYLGVVVGKSSEVNKGKLFGLLGVHSTLILNTSNIEFFEVNTPFSVGVSGGGRSFTTTTNITIVNSPYTVADGERVNVDCSGGDVILSVANATDNVYSFVKKDSSANTIIITPTTGTILGEGTLIVESQWDSAELISDGTNLTVI